PQVVGACALGAEDDAERERGADRRRGDQASPGADANCRLHLRRVVFAPDGAIPRTRDAQTAAVTPSTSAIACAAAGRTSSTVTVRPSSFAIVVNAYPSSPQAVIHCVNGAGSRSTLRAYPWVVTHLWMWIPIDAILRGGRSSQTPVRPSKVVLSRENASSVLASASSSSRQ